MAQVGSWPGVRSTSAECGLGVGLSVDARQVVHLHADGTAELFLTWPVIGRLSKALRDCGRVQMEPGGDWVRMRLESDSDVALLISLASVAIKAITSPTAADGRPRAYRRRPVSGSRAECRVTCRP
jgi:hypothetical protein